MDLAEYALFALSSLFVIIDPIALVPLFLTMTPTDTPKARERMARLACLVAAAVLVGFALLGNGIFRLLGISLPAFQMAGSVLLLWISLDMLRAQRSRVRETPEEEVAGAEKDDVAVTPLGVPMLAGPGAISTTILLESRATSLGERLVLYASVLAVCAVSYLILRWSAAGAHRLNPIALRIATRLMGLLLAAIACQFFINAVEAVRKGMV